MLIRSGKIELLLFVQQFYPNGPQLAVKKHYVKWITNVLMWFCKINNNPKNVILCNYVNP